jgi:hypothetical protein
MPNLYEGVLAVARIYMGAAADEYIRRRCKVSLGLDDPTMLSADQLDRLAKGIAMTAENYMSNEKTRQFQDAILKLGT